MSEQGAERRVRLRQKIEAKYPELELTDIQLDNYLDAQDRMKDQPTERQAEVGPISVHRASSDRVEDVLDFFDRRAFANNPGWASCYCMFHHLGSDGGPQWNSRTSQDNREELRHRIESGTTRGFVAYDGGEVIGWLNASDRSQFPEHATGDDEGVASVLCFVVAPTHRGHGVGALLLEAALDGLASEGTDRVQAYPVPDHVTDASAYKGRAKLFRETGFAEVDGDDSTVQRRL